MSDRYRSVESQLFKGRFDSYALRSGWRSRDRGRRRLGTGDGRCTQREKDYGQNDGWFVAPKMTSFRIQHGIPGFRKVTGTFRVYQLNSRKMEMTGLSRLVANELAILSDK